ncbi:MAG: DUF167 domain-containing protein [Candidatus Gastranaerophilales bacterium]|nr:DUF167 domain-containing protein [Candidatus Gastranaerophilales bacterium]
MSENNQKFITVSEKGVILAVKLTPNASKNEIIGYCDEYVKIKVSAPPNENKANKKLTEFAADFFDVAKSNVELIAGDKSRLKKLLIKNVSEEFVKQKIFVHDKIET